jgi:hypothetical protein
VFHNPSSYSQCNSVVGISAALIELSVFKLLLLG